MTIYASIRLSLQLEMLGFLLASLIPSPSGLGMRIISSAGYQSPPYYCVNKWQHGFQKSVSKKLMENTFLHQALKQFTYF